MPLTSDRDDPGLKKVDEKGMQESYLVLSEEERNKGFVRPLRMSYVHLDCGTVTSMALAIAQTYAKNPAFYGGTYCAGCCAHFPVGPDGQFVWERPRKDTPLGQYDKVGT